MWKRQKESKKIRNQKRNILRELCSSFFVTQKQLYCITNFDILSLGDLNGNKRNKSRFK